MPESSPCQFCLIARKEVGAWTVFEDDLCIAFLDRRPLFPGHLLLIPRLHVVTLVELPNPLVAPLFTAARMLAAAVEDATGAEGIFVAINNRVSQSVPHLHIHIVPRRRKDGLRGFFWPRTTYGEETEALDMQKRIQAAVDRLKEEDVV
ncbi:HIT family protein [Geobacter sp. DSM 9736]|uniref:HIT family protein n=1 Tax=Geobacter sp. DSM 9736 TaxID=1277350 RepID=UPI000B5108CD|nr:HIT family protein [Geobacter sp. DSM 9736]SNB46581.1 histidine triad (HIT) family protein [Geobacter sp. DSM 9736]